MDTCDRCTWSSGKKLREMTDEIERAAIAKALHQTSGNQTEAARLLSMPVRTLRNFIAFTRGRYIFKRRHKVST
jgi:transcriptional regulator with GAF, ATPase, and Fis domain